VGDAVQREPTVADLQFRALSPLTDGQVFRIRARRLSGQEAAVQVMTRNRRLTMECRLAW
jgi:hydroxyacyl-ACP dehydratase HTD2-like protein with hotdog domain